MANKLPLDMLSELARTATDKAAIRLGALQTARITSTQKLQLLIQYRQDYVDQLNALMVNGMPAAKLRNYQNFLVTLDGAIAQQRAIVTQADTRLDAGRVDWQHQKRRQSSFDTLAERVRQQEMLAQSKREQRESDERATRKFFDRAANPTL